MMWGDGKVTSGKRSKGFSTLLFTMVVLMSVTVLAFVSADAVVNNQRVVVSYHQSQSAFDAAQSGLEYGITYLEQNRETVSDGDTVSGSLGDGSTYSVTFAFQGGTNELVQVTSTGNTASGESTHQVRQLVKYVSDGGSALIDQPVISRGAVLLLWFSRAINNNNGSEGASIRSGNAVAFMLAAYTTIDGSISSYAGNLEDDVSLNDLSLSGMSDAEMEIQALGHSLDTLISEAAPTTVLELNGLEGGIHLLSESGGGTINVGDGLSSITVGTAENPATLVVDGDLAVNGDSSAAVIINGNLIVRGNMTLTGNVIVNGIVFVENSSSSPTLENGARVNGALVSANDVRLNLYTLSRVTYEPDLVNAGISAINVALGSDAGGTTGEGYGKVPGSWISLNP